MARSNGKVFENNFEKSAPSYAKAYRIPDPPQSFNRTNNLRFSRKNPFDYFLWDSKNHLLYALELKTVAGKSINFERTEDERKSDGIHYHQAQGLKEYNQYDGLICGFVIEFRGEAKTVFLDIDDYFELIKYVGKKSFCFKDLDAYDIPYVVIPQKIIRVNYRYDIDTFLKEKAEEFKK